MARNDGRIEKGQRLSSAISARAWNRAQQAADVVLGVQPGTAGDGASFISAPYTWVYAKNTTGSAVDRWGVMAITGVEITPSGSAVAEFERMPVLTGAGISGNETKERCVAVEPIDDGKLGRVAVAGAVQLKVSDLNKCPAAVVLWKDSTWAFVRLATATHYLAKTSSTWTKGTSATVQIYSGTPGSETAVSGLTVTAWNKFANVQSGKWVMLGYANGSWYLIAAEC